MRLELESEIHGLEKQEQITRMMVSGADLDDGDKEEETIVTRLLTVG